jgi:chaperonin GroES
MKLRMLHDRILVRRAEQRETTRGGIIIPDTAREKPQEGIVVAVGEGKRNDKGERIPIDVKVGDHILWSKYAGSDLPPLPPVQIDEEDYLIVREEEVLGIIEAGKPSAAAGKK